MPRIHTILGKGDKEIDPSVINSFFEFCGGKSYKNIAESVEFVHKKIGIIFGRIGCRGNIKSLEGQINFPILVLPFEFFEGQHRYIFTKFEY